MDAKPQPVEWNQSVLHLLGHRRDAIHFRTLSTESDVSWHPQGGIMMLGDDFGLSSGGLLASCVSIPGAFFSGIIKYFCAASLTLVMNPAVIKSSCTA